MLVGMDSKASHAKGMPGVTLTIATCLCAAFRARMGDVQCVPLVERVHVPTSLTFLLLYDDMFGQCAGPSAHGRCRSHSVIIQLVCHHPHCQFFAKFQCRHCHSFFARARVCTAFTSVTDKRKVNCRLGHHFVAQTSSKLGS